MKFQGFLAVLLSCLLAGCGSLPQAGRQSIQHDLGGAFEPLPAAPLPLRAVSVSAAPLASSLAMNFREAARPTERGSYAYNRWAAAPASLLDVALNRLLPLDREAACRLDFQLTELLLEIDAAGQGSVRLTGFSRIVADDRRILDQRPVELSEAVARVEPAALALGARAAARRLALTLAANDAAIEAACRRAPRKAF